MKRLIVLTLGLSLLGCIHQKMNRRPSGELLPRHVVIAVHGIGGDDSTWGDMGEVLTTHLRALNPHFRYEFYNFKYPTGDYGRDTFTFGHEFLGRFIQSKVFGENEIGPEDRITFVAHSQGGLVSTIWYTDTLMSDEADAPEELKPLREYVKYARKVDAIVTLGTPFWGSKLAARLTDKRKLDISRLANLNNPRELEEMTFGSNTIYKFRRTTIAISRKPTLREQITARMVNISGIFPLDKRKLYYRDVDWNEPDCKIATMALDFIHTYFSKIGFGYDRYESDIAVLVPNSRIDFLFSDNLRGGGEPPTFQTAEIFNGNTKHIMTESVHTAVMAKYNVAMALIPKYCLNLEECLHPTYRYVLREVANCEANNCDTDKANVYFSALARVNADDERTNLGLAENLRGFTVDVVLRLPDGYDLEDPRFKSQPGLAYSAVQNNGEKEATIELSPALFFKKAVSLNADSSGVINGTSPLVRAQIGDSTEYLSKMVSQHTITFRGKTHTDLRLTLTGTVIPTARGVDDPIGYAKAIQEGVLIPIAFHLPGLEKQQAKILVKPGLSSFLELQTRYAR